MKTLNFILALLFTILSLSAQEDYFITESGGYYGVLDRAGYEEAITSYKNLNSISLLTFHINYYTQGVLDVFKGKDLSIRNVHSFDMKPLTNETEWHQLHEQLTSNAKEFASHLSQLSDVQIEDVFVNEKYVITTAT